MIFNEFIDKYDKIGSVVLLEGKRDVKESDKISLINFGRLLADMTRNIVFRSGNADGADFYFTKGVYEIASERIQIITPYKGHKNQKNLGYDIIDIDDINLAEEPLLIRQTIEVSKGKNIINKYLNGEKDRNSVKAPYLLRDTAKVLGVGHFTPANFAFFYDDLENPKKGGTGHTMKICEMNGVPFLTQETWLSWLNKKS